MFVRLFPRQCKQVWRKQNETREKEKREKEGGGEKGERKEEKRKGREKCEGGGARIRNIEGGKNRRNKRE